MLNFKVGHFTWPSATGNYAVTGLGFKPKVVYLYGTRTTLGAPYSIGNTFISKGAMTDQGEQYATCEAVEMGAGTGGGGALAQRIDRCFTAWKLWTDAGPITDASYVSMDSDGFTINVLTLDTTGREVGYLAWGGDSLRASKITEHGLQPNIVESYRTFDLGCEPDLLLCGSVGSPASGNREGLEPTTYSCDTAITSRADAGSGGRLLSCLACSAAQSTTLAGSACAVFSTPFRFLDGSSPGLMFNSFMRAMGAGKLSIFRNIEADDPLYFHALAMTGIEGHALTITVPSSPQSVQYVNPGFKPDGMFFWSTCSTGPVGFVTRANSAFGFTDGTNHFACGTSTLRSEILGVTRRRTAQYMNPSASIHVLSTPADAGAVIGTVTSFDPTGFTINWTTVTKNARVQAFSFRARPVAHASPETFHTGLLR